MKIYYKTTTWEGKKDSVKYDVVRKKTVFCCKEMKEDQCDCSVMNFGGEDRDTPELILGVPLGSENWRFTNRVVKFCPFCGETVTLIEVEKVRFVPRQATRTITETVYDQVK